MLHLMAVNRYITAGRLSQILSIQDHGLAQMASISENYLVQAVEEGVTLHARNAE